MAHDDDVLVTIICAGVMVFGIAMIAAVLEWQARKDEERRQEDTMILDVLLNEESGNVLGDSEMLFAYQDMLGTSPGDMATIESILVEAESNGF